jgi:hypothetical protein
VSHPGGELLRASLDGPFDDEFIVPKFAPRPMAVRVDEHAIYWSTADEESGQGAIWMLCKSAR